MPGGAPGRRGVSTVAARGAGQPRRAGRTRPARS
ncbi:hypothetical protein STRAU_3862 [Streptomyces aurantiacus JA 4570]|uniref:Uncharacterized protein n=1 Tax=Streptomyces aurantiacus JA 4570 TaxID=1286094 RepID=S3ZIW8_9ACTN|nr:hypothetical protein STRAU_3862 [Streptomyces aurantiacus JA 4570]